MGNTPAEHDRVVPAESKTRARTIVVVDDELTMCSLLADILTEGGYNPVVTSDPRAATELVRREKPVLVLADITMPHMDGYAVMEALHADTGTCYCPVMFLTGHLTFSERLKAFRCGARDYVTKPFTPEKLLASIARVLDDRHTKPSSP